MEPSIPNMNLVAEWNSCKRIRLRYRLVDGKAFTEENILIYNLFIYDLPKTSTVPLIKAYFEKFGKLLKVRLLRNCTGKRSFVYFVDPKSAAKALLEANHILKNCAIRVEPCHSFRQPDGRKFIKHIEKNLKSDSVLTPVEQDGLIFILNDYCLECIWLCLRLKDRINFALTCRRFCDVVIMSSRLNYSYLHAEIFNTCTLWNAVVFLHIIGPQVTKLKIFDLNENSLYKILSSLCLNVEEVEVENCKDTSLLRTLIQKMDKLRCLELDGNFLGDKFIKYFRKFENLNLLFITTNKFVRGKNIELLNKLESLSLNQCRRITPKNFRKICENLTSLHYLDIRACDLLRQDDFEYIPKYLQRLICLKTNIVDEDLEFIVKLPELEDLTLLEYGSRITGAFSLKQLLTLRNQMLQFNITISVINLENASIICEFKHLQDLRCHCRQLTDEMIIKFSHLRNLLVSSFDYCNQITNNAVLMLLLNCTRLQHLALGGCCILTAQLIPDVVKLLSTQMDLGFRKRPLVLVLSFDDEESKFHVHPMRYPGVLEVRVFVDSRRMYLDSDDSDDSMQ